MKQKCMCCGFEADAEIYKFEEWNGQTLCGLCLDEKREK